MCEHVALTVGILMSGQLYQIDTLIIWCLSKHCEHERVHLHDAIQYVRVNHIITWDAVKYCCHRVSTGLIGQVSHLPC